MIGSWAVPHCGFLIEFHACSYTITSIIA
jgi:hypothetical protein